MFDKISIAQKDTQVALKKPLVHWLKFLSWRISLFDIPIWIFQFFCLFVVATFMIFDLQKLASNNSWRACWPPWPPRIHSVHPNGVLHHLIREFPAELQSWNHFPPLRKCPSASAVFTSVRARYNAEFLLGQNLVSHVLSIEIGACIILLWSSTWWR